MLGIRVFFNNGIILECQDVVNTRAFWRMVSKRCKHTNRSLFFKRYSPIPMRVLCVEYSHDTKERDHI